MDINPILIRLEKIEDKQETIISILLDIQSSIGPGEGLDALIDPNDLSKKLNMSDRNLRRLKNKGILVPLSLGARSYYLESEVMKALKEHRVRKK
ncbi:MAG TPA: hypothetical protein VGE26_11375 [Sphingobacteriaceae bacterium]